MKKILILGAGKSSNHLIRYLAEKTPLIPAQLTIADIAIDQIPPEIANKPEVTILKISTEEQDPFCQLIEGKSVVISMLPAAMHPMIAGICLRWRVHLITPSYISEAMQKMHGEAKAKDLIFLNEMGFDPGIDHMMTMKIYHSILENGGILKGYRSYAGGLVAPLSDNNPWNYKFSWNPRNVILAGQGGEILSRREGKEVRLDYRELFKKHEKITVQKVHELDAYANRDSLRYESLYHWHDVETLLRGTLRKPGFCQAWSMIIDWGLTDDSRQIELNEGASYHDFYNLFLALDESKDLVASFQSKYHIWETALLNKFEFIGFFDRKTKLDTLQGSAAQILQSILEKKWKLNETDTDWVVMAHYFVYEQNGRKYQLESSLSLEGEDQHYTAMSRTVGMPIAYACRLILENRISQRGVLLPVEKEIYEPVLKQLHRVGICFKEYVDEIT